MGRRGSSLQKQRVHIIKSTTFQILLVSIIQDTQEIGDTRYRSTSPDGAGSSGADMPDGDAGTTESAVTGDESRSTDGVRETGETQETSDGVTGTDKTQETSDDVTGTDKTQETSDGVTGTDKTQETSDGVTGTDKTQETSDGVTETDKTQQTSDGVTGTDKTQETSDGVTGTDKTQETSDGVTGTDKTQETSDGVTGTDKTQETSDGVTETDKTQQSSDDVTGTGESRQTSSLTLAGGETVIPEGTTEAGVLKPETGDGGLTDTTGGDTREPDGGAAGVTERGGDAGTTDAGSDKASEGTDGGSTGAPSGTERTSDGGATTDAPQTDGGKQRPPPEGDSTQETSTGTTAPQTTGEATTQQEDGAPANRTDEVFAKLHGRMRIQNKNLESWTKELTRQFVDKVSAALQTSFGSAFRSVAVTATWAGSVIVEFDVTVLTNATEPAQVETEALAAQTDSALRTVTDDAQFTFDHAATSVNASDVQITNSTETPARRPKQPPGRPSGQEEARPAETAETSTPAGAAGTAERTTGAPGTTGAASSGDSASTTATGSSGTTGAGNGTETAGVGAEAAGNETATVGNETSAVNATETTVVTTTMGPTTTKPPSPLVVVFLCQLKIKKEWVSPLSIKILPQFQELAGQVIAAVTPALRAKFNNAFLSASVRRFYKGSVMVDLDVELQTDKTSVEDVETARLAAETTEALQQVLDVGEYNFDPSAVSVSEEVQVIEPTTTPAPTPDPYQANLIWFAMRAPNENYTDEMNDTSSTVFKEMDEDLDLGVKEMLRKKYPPGDWNVTAVLNRVYNDTEEGLWIEFVVTVSPQMPNTTAVVAELGKAYVHFSRLGKLQIDPTSVRTKDLTTYAPGLGVVIMDEEYRRELRKALFNGTYVGDYTTARPTLRPVVKRHKQNIIGIAVPAFVGMMAALGLLLICTTVAGTKKVD